MNFDRMPEGWCEEQAHYRGRELELHAARLKAGEPLPDPVRLPGWVKRALWAAFWMLVGLAAVCTVNGY